MREGGREGRSEVGRRVGKMGGGGRIKVCVCVLPCIYCT